MNYRERRDRVGKQMKESSVLILFSGVELHDSLDAYAAFEANRHFFYLTGLRRERMILVMVKDEEKLRTMLFLEEADPTAVRWTGKRVSKEEAKEISGIEEIYYLPSFEGMVNRLLGGEIDTLYCDCSRNQWDDLPDYNTVRIQEIVRKYPGVQIKNIVPVVAKMRMQKDEDEIREIRNAIDVTDKALQNVMSRLQPGKREYQVQADFEYTVHDLGADGVAFPTIAGSGANGTMLHYETNRDTCEDGSLILLDLGAKVHGYCADITRTYPVNGKYSPRQRQVYDIVLKANREVVKAAKPGVTLRELQKLTSDILAQGCIELGLIEKPEEIGKYYMHGVSHHLGIDVHDVTAGFNTPLAPGTVITDEPGLYIDEWEIGIRIEDDLLITQEGCEVLSEAVIRDPDAIEAFMAEHKQQ